MTVKLHPISYIFISLILCLLFQGCDQEEELEKQSAPDFTLQDLSGNEVSLRQHKGQIVLLDFWATWCAPCRRSIPELVDIQEKYRDQGLVILGVSADDPQKTSVESLLAFKEQYKINYSILRTSSSVNLLISAQGKCLSRPCLSLTGRAGSWTAL